MPDWGFAQVDQQWYNTPALLADAERMYTEVKALQPKYWRIGAAWSLIAKQREPGTTIAGTPPTSTGRDWTTLDTALNEALLLGAEVILILGVRKASWGGVWFGPFSFGATWGSGADFQAWCAEVVTRYKVGGPGVRTDGRYAPNAGKGVHIFEIWNEENDQNHWGAFVSARDYTGFLNAAYDGIKSVLPGTSSTVLFGGTYHVQRIPPWPLYGIASLPEVDFVSQCYNYGAKFDAMAVHVYPHLDDISFNGSDVGPVPTMNLDNMRQLTEIRAVMVAKGDGAKRIWITEAGFPCSNVTEAQQKTYWETLWGLFSALSYIEAVLFYCARDGGTDPHQVEATWGAMRYDLTHKPVWEFLQTLSPPPVANPAFAGVGSLTATAIRAVAAAFSGAGVLAATTPPRVTAAFSGAGVLDAMADKNSGERNANLDGSGSLSATVTPVLSLTSTFTGLGALTATATPRLSVAAPFTGAGSLSSAAQAVGAGRNADFTGSGSLSVVAFTPVLWNSTGAGGITATTAAGSKSVSWTHNTTVTGAGVWVFAELGVGYSTGLSGQSYGCNYGSTPMNLIGYKGAAQASAMIFGLQSPPTGSQTVTATVTPTGGDNVTSLQGTSVAFTNVGAVVSPTVGTSGVSSVRAVTVAAGAGSRALAVTAGNNAASTPVWASHTPRYAGGTGGSGFGKFVTVQDGPGEADGFVDLTSTQSASGSWGALGLVLTPVIPVPTAAPAFTGSGALTASGFASFSRAADFAGAGTLKGAIEGSPTADFTGTGSLSATTVVVHSRPAAFAGSGSLSAVGFEVYTRAAALTGSGALSADPNSGFPYTFPYNLG